MTGRRPFLEEQLRKQKTKMNWWRVASELMIIFIVLFVTNSIIDYKRNTRTPIGDINTEELQEIKATLHDEGIGVFSIMNTKTNERMIMNTLTNITEGGGQK